MNASLPFVRLLSIATTCACLLFSHAARAADVASVASPGGVLKVTLSLNGEGRIGYAVSRKDKMIVEESRLGFLLADAPQLLRNFKLESTEDRSFDETWEQPWGEWRRIRNHYNELAATFAEKAALKRRLR